VRRRGDDVGDVIDSIAGVIEPPSVIDDRREVYDDQVGDRNDPRRVRGELRSDRNGSRSVQAHRNEVDERGSRVTNVRRPVAKFHGALMIDRVAV
jgi:hypothetical protein